MIKDYDMIQEDIMNNVCDGVFGELLWLNDLKYMVFS
jgi:hypothetical protein